MNQCKVFRITGSETPKAGVLRQVGAKLCRTLTQDWTLLD